MGFKSYQIESICNTLYEIDPSLKKENIEDIVASIIKEKIKDPYILIENDIIHESEEISLIKLCNWINKRNPVISGNATFYCQPNELRSPTSNMLKSMKKGRKSVKKEMFKFKAGSDEYNMKDLEQGNLKVIMNAEYGGSGAPTAAFYNKYSPAATTLMAQSIITTMAAFFESYVGDNQKFYSINECFDWFTHLRKKNNKIPSWIKRHTHDEVLARIARHFMKLSEEDYNILKMYIMNRNENELPYLYYANNLNEFINEHSNVKELIVSILSKLPKYKASADEVPNEFKNKFDNSSDYNKWISGEMFLDPYSVPEVVKEEINELNKLVNEFVFVKYLTPDSIVKLNNHKRNTVLLVDTDSNMIHADLFVSFILDKVIFQNTFNREKIYNEMILCNILASLLDTCVKEMLDYYCECHNIPMEERSELTMKNEFMFKRFILMLTKKRYIASILLREGNIMIPMLTEIKGMDFIKAGVSDVVSKRFTKIIEDHLLFSEELELHELMVEVKNFEKDIYKDLKNGGISYLKQQQFKDGGYKSMIAAWSLPVFRGTMVWNELYPDRKINSFDKVGILKTIIKDVNDLDIIKDKFPKEYEMVKNKIFNNSYKEIKDAGLKYISIPISSNLIPDWLLPLIDYELIISDIISTFRSVLDALKLGVVKFKTPNGKAIITSCLISI